MLGTCSGIVVSIIWGVWEDTTRSAVESTEMASNVFIDDMATVIACEKANVMTKSHFSPAREIDHNDR